MIVDFLFGFYFGVVVYQLLGGEVALDNAKGDVPERFEKLVLILWPLAVVYSAVRRMING